MKQHHSPIPSEIVQRYKFHTRSRKTGESVATFVAELRALAEFCNFGTTLEDMLRDRLVCGINDEHTQRRLLSEPTLTFKKALEVAQGLEMAAKNARTLQPKAGLGTPTAWIVRVGRTISVQCKSSKGRGTSSELLQVWKEQSYRSKMPF